MYVSALNPRWSYFRMGENSLTYFYHVFFFFQAVVWQKSKVSDHGAALMAVLGSSIATNLLPIQHHHEQAEVSDALGNSGKSVCTQQKFWVPFH